MVDKIYIVSRKGQLHQRNQSLWTLAVHLCVGHNEVPELGPWQ